MKCPKCGFNCVKKYQPTAFLPDPLIYCFTWWCKCGFESKVESENPSTLLSQEELLTLLWEEANKEK